MLSCICLQSDTCVSGVLQRNIVCIIVRAYADAVIIVTGGAARSGCMAAASARQEVSMMLLACMGHWWVPDQIENTAQVLHRGMQTTSQALVSAAHKSGSRLIRRRLHDLLI